MLFEFALSKIFVFLSSFCLNLLKLLAFLGRHQFCVCEYTVMQDFILFGTTDNGWTQLTAISLSSQWQIFFFPLYAFQWKQYFGWNPRARRWTLTSLSSCWMSVKGRMEVVVWVVRYIEWADFSALCGKVLYAQSSHKSELYSGFPLLLSSGNYCFNWISLDQLPRSTADNRSVEDAHVAGWHHAICSCKRFLDKVKILYWHSKKSLVFK